MALSRVAPTRPDPPRPARVRGDGGAILLSSLVKFVVAIALIGVIGYDAFSIASVQVRVRDVADQASQTAHDALRARDTPAEAYAKAEVYAKDHDATIAPNGFRVDANGAVTVTVTATAETFVAGRIPALKDWVSPRATSTARNSIY